MIVFGENALPDNFVTNAPSLRFCFRFLTVATILLRHVRSPITKHPLLICISCLTRTILDFLHYIHSPVGAYNTADPVSGYSGAPRNITMIPEKLASAGYYTALVGKWDTGQATTRHFPKGEKEMGKGS